MITNKVENPLAPENLGYLALYACICREIPVDDALRAVGIRVLRKAPGKRLLDDKEYEEYMGLSNRKEGVK